MTQLANASPEERHEAMKKWHQDNAQALSEQQQLANEMRTESGSPISKPPELRIPENASPEMREFLTTRHAFMKDQMEVMNQLRNASPEERRVAMEKWQAENNSRRKAMQEAADKLSKSQTH
jgi:hypothetical protein